MVTNVIRKPLATQFHLTHDNSRIEGEHSGDRHVDGEQEHEDHRPGPGSGLSVPGEHEAQQRGSADQGGDG